MKVLGRKAGICAGVSFLILAMVASAGAVMGPGMTGNQGMFGAGSMMSGSAGGFGMMNGMMGTPVVGDDGTAYLVSFTPSTSPGSAPTSTSFTSTLLAVSPTGQTTTLSLKGMTSRPVVFGNVLVATASIPDMGDYMMLGNFGSNPQADQSVLYILTLPLAATSQPSAISLDGDFASIPVIAHNRIYVTTTDFGSGMMGTSSFAGMFGGNYNFNMSGTAKSYLYIINLDGTAPVKVTLP